MADGHGSALLAPLAALQNRGPWCSVLICVPGFTVGSWATPQPQFPFRQFKGVSVNEFLHNHPVKNECLYRSLSTDQITKHGFLEVHFIAVLIGFHGNLENVSRLCCDQAASS